MNNLIFIDYDKLFAIDQRFYPDGQIATKDAEVEVGIALTGPSVKGKQTIRYRPPTILERIARVRQSLTQAGELAPNRPEPYRGRDTELHYVEEDLTAYSTVIPAGNPDDPRSRPITIWFVPATEVYGALLLLEDLRTGLTTSLNASLHSSYSVLQSFLFYTRQELDRSKLASHFPKKSPPEHGKVDKDHIASAIQEARSAHDYSVEFAKHADTLLAQWGVLPIGPQRIHAFYSVREYGNENSLGGRVSVFGYPICIERLPLRMAKNDAA